MDNCLFCKIIRGETASSPIYMDENLMVIDDIDPQAPHHKLIIPRKHIATINDLQKSDNDLLGQMINAAKMLAHRLEIDEKGYRLVMNCNQEGGQAIYHIHLHLLGGRAMHWPPG